MMMLMLRKKATERRVSVKHLLEIATLYPRLVHFENSQSKPIKNFVSLDEVHVQLCTTEQSDE